MWLFPRELSKLNKPRYSCVVAALGNREHLNQTPHYLFMSRHLQPCRQTYAANRAPQWEMASKALKYKMEMVA